MLLIAIFLYAGCLCQYKDTSLLSCISLFIMAIIVPFFLFVCECLNAFGSSMKYHGISRCTLGLFRVFSGFPDENPFTTFRTKIVNIAFIIIVYSKLLIHFNSTYRINRHATVRVSILFIFCQRHNLCIAFNTLDVRNHQF